MDAAASKINFNSPVSGSSNTNEFMYKSLGTTLSTTKFVARFKFQYNTFGINGVWEYPFVLSAGTSWALTANQDAIGVWVDNYSRGHARAFYKDGSGSLTEGSAPSAAMVTGTVYYMELVIDPTTPSATVTIRTGSHTGTTHSTSTVTIPSTISGLNTLQHLGTVYTGGTGYTYDSELSETKIYNAVTSVTPATWTMEPTFEDVFDGTHTWTHSHANTSISGGVLNWNSKLNGNVNEEAYISLGTTLSDTAFVCDFDVTIANWTQGSYANNIAFGVCLSNNTADYGTSQDSIEIRWRGTGSVRHIEVYDHIGSAPEPASNDGRFTETISEKTFYVRITRLSATSYTIALFPNSADRDSGTNADETHTGTTTSSLNALQYAKVFITEDANTDHVLNGTLDNLKIYNGVTTPN